MMNRGARAVTVMMLLLGMASACSTDSNGDGGTSNETKEAATTGDINCETVTAAMNTVGVGVQVLAQLKTQAQYDLINDGVLAFDPDEFDVALDALSPLRDVDTPLGSVSEALDLYREANALARENLAVEDPFTQAKGDELATLNEDLTTFLAGQAPLSYAREEVGC